MRHNTLAKDFFYQPNISKSNMTYKPRFFICCAVQILNSQRKESMQFANKLLIGSSPWFEATEKRDGDAASPQEPTKDQG